MARRAADRAEVRAVDEVYIFEVREGRLVSALGVEDNLSRLRQLRIFPEPA